MARLDGSGDWQHSAQRVAVEAVAVSTGPNVSTRAALAFALSRDFAQAKKIADKLAHEHPLDTEIQYCFLPPARAAIALGRNFGSSTPLPEARTT